MLILCPYKIIVGITKSLARKSALIKIAAAASVCAAFSICLAQQPPRWQAKKECDQAKELSKQIAELKNEGATRDTIETLISMSSDGDGIIGELARTFFNLHKKGSSPAKFSASMFQRCMRSNGY
jgi:hypothetical protein